jgi:CHASE3 domain sensor protein
MNNDTVKWSTKRKIVLVLAAIAVVALIAVVSVIAVRQNAAKAANEINTQKGLITKAAENCSPKSSGDETIDYSDDGKSMTIYEPVSAKASGMTGFACVKKMMDMRSVTAKDLEALKVYGKIYGGTDSETWDHWKIVWDKSDDGTTATITYTGNENYQ